MLHLFLFFEKVGNSASLLLGFQKRLHVNSRFAEDRPQCALGEIAGMMWDGDLPSRLRVTPDLMTAGALTVELKAESAKAAYCLAVRESR